MFFAASVNKKMKKILIAVALMAVLIVPISNVKAQEVATSTATSTMTAQEQYQSLLLQLINLLIQQVQMLQDQIAKMQAAPISAPAPQNAPVSQAPMVSGGSVSQAAPLPADEYPVILFSVDGQPAENTDVSAAEHRIEWLAVQKDKHDLSCSSSEIGKMGTQGSAMRTWIGTFTITMTCTDNITLVETTKILTLRVL